MLAAFASVMVCSCACQAGRLAVIEGESVPVERGAAGVARCPGGEAVKVSFLLPVGKSVASASHAYEVNGRLVRLSVDSRERQDVRFSLILSRSCAD